MAVSEQTPYIEYTANGTTTGFALEFDCENQDHLIVLVDDVEPVVGTWSLSSGAVVFNTAPVAGKKITLQRNTPFSRTTDYQSYNNSFRPPAVNKDFDWIWWKLQELGVADWILGARIDALKNYVDDRDDELRAYLMEEIRKQGVALDQLDEYYNYLMQRLAQIAVDKGWDASFVVDASGKTQQEINDEQELLNADQTAFNSRFTNIKDKPTLQEIINSFNSQPDPIKRGDILFNSSEDVDVPEQIEISQGRIKLEGRNSVLKWTGTDPAKAVLRVYDSSMTVIKDMAILGDTANPPLAAVLYDNNNAALIGSNEMNVLENVIIGRKVLSDNTRSFRCTYGVYVRPGGYGNNDQFTLRNVAANDTLEAGFFIEGDQHIWSTMDSCLVNIGKVGFKLGSNMTLNNAQCNRLTEVDFEAMRNIEVWINGMFSEHPKMAIKSTGGSFYVKGGKVLKNPTVKEPIIQFISGGFLSLDGVLFASATNPHLNYIDYNGGAVKDGGVLIRGCNIANGYKRDYYKIHTATNGWKEHKIDIECSNFVFKTNAPYSDEAKAGATANANSSAVFSSAQASKLGRGKFFHSAVSTGLPTGVQVPVCVDASVYRVHVMNRTGANIAIGDCNVRGMELSDRLLGSNFAAAQDLIFTSGRGVVKVNIPLLGVKKGHYIIPTSTTATFQAPMYAYATADNVATVVVETMSNIATTLTAQVIGAAKFDESKARFHAQKAIAEITLASKTFTTVDIDCIGVQIGSHCLVSSSEDLSDLLVTAHCSIDGKIRVTIYNPQSTPVIIPVDTILKVCAVF